MLFIGLHLRADPGKVAKVLVKDLDKTPPKYKDEEQDIYYMIYEPSIYTKEQVTLFPIRGKSNAIKAQKRLQDAIEAEQIEVDMRDLDDGEDPYYLIKQILAIIGFWLLAIIISFTIIVIAC